MCLLWASRGVADAIDRTPHARVGRSSAYVRSYEFLAARPDDLASPRQSRTVAELKRFEHRRRTTANPRATADVRCPQAGGVRDARFRMLDWTGMDEATRRSTSRSRRAAHPDLTTTQRYMHLSPAALDSAIRLLESAGTR